jgi:cytochrome b6-f complex iron-sulfur subunit
MERRTFIRLTGFTLLVPLSWLWIRMSERLEQTRSVGTAPKVLKNIAEGVNFFDEYIVVSLNGTTSVFSSRCSHAGCRISKSEGNQLICPCHGSRYDALSGKVIKGPSLENLKKLTFRLDKPGGDVIIDKV